MTVTAEDDEDLRETDHPKPKFLRHFTTRFESIDGLTNLGSGVKNNG
jgi:hypothetical protein